MSFAAAKKTLCMICYFPDEKDKQASQTGASEDPPNDVTKQNNPGDDKKNKEEINVPEKALEHYKESAKDTEE